MVDDELRALVSVNPPSGFQTRVISRIATAPTRKWWIRWPAHTVALSAAVALALLVARWPVPGTNAPSPLASNAHRLLTPPAASIRAQPIHTARPHYAVAPNTVDVVEPKDGAVVAFDRAETLALQRLFASNVAAAVTDSAPAPDGPIAFAEIVIPPLPVGASLEGASR